MHAATPAGPLITKCTLLKLCSFLHRRAARNPQSGVCILPRDEMLCQEAGKCCVVALDCKGAFLGGLCPVWGAEHCQAN